MAKKLIKSFEQACKEQGLDPAKVLPDVSCLPEQDRKAIIAYAKLCIIQRSLNGKWVADWSDWNQAKYYPWYDVVKKEGSPSGFGLSFHDYDCVASGRASVPASILKTGKRHGMRLRHSLSCMRTWY